MQNPINIVYADYYSPARFAPRILGQVPAANLPAFFTAAGIALGWEYAIALNGPEARQEIAQAIAAGSLVIQAQDFLDAAAIAAPIVAQFAA